MNKDKAIARIHKYGKIGKIITIIMMVLLISSTIGTLLGIVALKLIPNGLISLNIGTQAEMVLDPKAISADIPESEFDQVLDAFNSGKVSGGLNLGAVSLKFDHAEKVDGKIVCTTDKGEGNVSLNKIANALFVVIASLALTFVSVLFGFRLCKAFETCASPFEAHVIKKMRYFAYSLLPWALFSSVPDSVLNSVFGNHLQVSFSLNMNIIITVLIILALTMVFKYGAFLQQESDETL